jgi:hypothetical protein
MIMKKPTIPIGSYRHNLDAIDRRSRAVVISTLTGDLAADFLQVQRTVTICSNTGCRNTRPVYDAGARRPSRRTPARPERTLGLHAVREAALPKSRTADARLRLDRMPLFIAV